MSEEKENDKRHHELTARVVTLEGKVQILMRVFWGVLTAIMSAITLIAGAGINHLFSSLPS